MHLDAEYYISRVLIPPLQRIFSLVGADVRSWYDEMPKPGSEILQDASTNSTSEDEHPSSPSETTTEELSEEDISEDVSCLSCDQPSTTRMYFSNVNLGIKTNIEKSYVNSV